MEGEQLLHNRIPKLRGRQVFGQLDSQLWPDHDPQLASRPREAAPANVGVGAERLAAHKGNVAMTEIVQMPQRQFRGPIMAQHYIADPRNFMVAGNGDRGHSELVIDICIDRDQTFGAAAHQHLWIALYQIGTMTMVRNKVKVVLVEEM